MGIVQSVGTDRWKLNATKMEAIEEDRPAQGLHTHPYLRGTEAGNTLGADGQSLTKRQF